MFQIEILMRLVIGEIFSVCPSHFGVQSFFISNHLFTFRMLAKLLSITTFFGSCTLRAFLHSEYTRATRKVPKRAFFALST